MYSRDTTCTMIIHVRTAHHRCQAQKYRAGHRAETRQTFYLFFRNILCVFTFLHLFRFVYICFIFYFSSRNIFTLVTCYIFYIFDIFALFYIFQFYILNLRSVCRFFLLFSFFMFYIVHLRSVCIFNCVGCMRFFVTVSPTTNGPTRKSDSSLI